MFVEACEPYDNEVFDIFFRNSVISKEALKTQGMHRTSVSLPCGSYIRRYIMKVDIKDHVFIYPQAA